MKGTVCSLEGCECRLDDNRAVRAKTSRRMYRADFSTLKFVFRLLLNVTNLLKRSSDRPRLPRAEHARRKGFGTPALCGRWPRDLQWCAAGSLHALSLTPEHERSHVATFDAAEGEEYNRTNCQLARSLFAT